VQNLAQLLLSVQIFFWLANRDTCPVGIGREGSPDVYAFGAEGGCEPGLRTTGVEEDEVSL
jgi:hypothetical protein